MIWPEGSDLAATFGVILTATSLIGLWEWWGWYGKPSRGWHRTPKRPLNRKGTTR